jgi:hypothetical protein
MKKVFLMLAFAGLVGSVSASVNQDDKDKTAKKECKKEGKSCCKDKKGAEGKACAADSKGGEKKSCCKDKKMNEAKPAETK